MIHFLNLVKFMALDLKVKLKYYINIHFKAHSQLSPLNKFG